MIDIRTASLLDFVPASIADDVEVQRIAAAFDPEMQAAADALIETIIMPRIDDVPEAVLDAIGKSMRLTELRAWELATGDKVEGKRRLLRNILDLRKRAGTRYATRRIFDLLLLSATVFEWWEEAAAPNTYRIEVEASEAGATLLELQQIPGMLRRFARASQQLTQLATALSRTAPVRIYPALTSGLLVTIGSP